MPIYTRTGDKGKTSLMSGQRVSKSDIRVDAYGTIDELNSAIGIVIAEVQSAKFPTSLKLRGASKVQSHSLQLKVELIKIQNDLLEIGSALANPASKTLKYLKIRVKEFEEFIDKMTEQMSPLKNFILPGGGKAGAALHLARAISRRAERKIVELNNKQKIDNNVIIYINRLSDLLFTMARFANFKEKQKETIWPA